MITPPKDKVIVTPMFDSDETGFEGLDGQSIIQPSSSKGRCDQGLVKYVGSKVTEDYGIEIGQHVIFSGYTGTLVEIEGEGLLIILPADFITAVLGPPATEIPGLFFEGTNGEFFTATYEQAMSFIADGLQESDWYKKINVKIHIPDKAEYEKWHS